MKKLNQIGLDLKQANNLSKGLNELLANYQIFYGNLRGFHWLIQGDKFFELHLKFEELYNDSLVKVDEIAERILVLGSLPIHTYSGYLKVSTIKESKKITDGYAAVKNVLDSYKILLSIERKLLDKASEINDEGTNALMSDYIREQEKLIWMYSAFLKKTK